MLNYILKPIKHESFYKKYAGKRYFKVGIAERSGNEDVLIFY